MAVVSASTTGDSYTGILLGIPGANSAATAMVDGFPLAQQGKATYTLSAAVTTSTLNGLLWGSLVFLFLPFYAQLMLIFGVPELWAFTILAFTFVVFIASNNWIKGLVALFLGVFLGAVGTDPNTASERFTLGWFLSRRWYSIDAYGSRIVCHTRTIDWFPKRTDCKSIPRWDS